MRCDGAPAGKMHQLRNDWLPGSRAGSGLEAYFQHLVFTAHDKIPAGEPDGGNPYVRFDEGSSGFGNDRPLRCPLFLKI